MRNTFVIFILFCSFLGNSVASVAATDTQPIDNEERCSLQFDNASILSLIEYVSDITTRTFVYDEAELRGKVTLRTATPISITEAYQLFLTVLQTKGLRAVDNGVSIRIEKDTLPTLLANPESQGSYITKVITFKHINAAEVLNSTLKLLLAKQVTVVAYPPSNSIIMTGPIAKLKRIADIAEKLDIENASGSLHILEVKHASATNLAKLCTDILQKTSSQLPSNSGTRISTRRTHVSTGSSATSSKVTIYADPDSNSLLAYISDHDFELLTELLEHLDVEPSESQSTINVYHLHNAGAEALMETLTALFSKSLATKGVVITADKLSNTLLIDATTAQYKHVKKVIAELDVEQRQVAVEALILELSMDATEALGVALKGGFETGNDGAMYAATRGATATDPSNLLSTAISGLLVGGFFNPITYLDAAGQEVTTPAISALINLSKTSADVNIMSAPRLVTSDNQEAEIIVGENVPIVTNRLTDTGSSGLAQSVSVERKDVALHLKITPQVVDNNKVRLSVYQEITDLSTRQVGNIDEVGPTFKKRLLRNNVLVEDGQTIILGGLIGKTSQTVSDKIPFLGDIPSIGWLFKTETTSTKKTNILVLITPKILKSRAEADALTASSRRAMKEFDETGHHIPISEEVILERHMNPKQSSFRRTFQKAAHRAQSLHNRFLLTHHSDFEMETLYLDTKDSTQVHNVSNLEAVSIPDVQMLEPIVVTSSSLRLEPVHVTRQMGFSNSSVQAVRMEPALEPIQKINIRDAFLH